MSRVATLILCALSELVCSCSYLPSLPVVSWRKDLYVNNLLRHRVHPNSARVGSGLFAQLGTLHCPARTFMCIRKDTCQNAAAIKRSISDVDTDVCNSEDWLLLARHLAG